MLHNIKQVVAVEPYKVTLLFNDFSVKQVDFTSKIQKRADLPNSPYKQLQDKEYFK